jgi:Mce-associated membrane protein
MPDKNESEAPDTGDAVSADAAEAAAAEAEARAEAARARANELRRKLEASRAETAAITETEAEDAPVPADSGAGEFPAAFDEADSADEFPAAFDEADNTAPAKRVRLGTVLRVASATLVVLVIAGLLGGTGYMVWQHQKAEQERHRSAEFAAAARQSVVNLMSLDYTKAKEMVQRVLDESTGKFRSNYEDESGNLIKGLQDGKIVTKVEVNNSAVESMDKDSATVLVAATSRRTGADAPKEDQQPRVWRMVVSLVREGDRLKMSDFEFI